MALAQPPRTREVLARPMCGFLDLLTRQDFCLLKHKLHLSSSHSGKKHSQKPGANVLLAASLLCCPCLSCRCQQDNRAQSLSLSTQVWLVILTPNELQTSLMPTWELDSKEAPDLEAFQMPNCEQIPTSEKPKPFWSQALWIEASKDRLEDRKFAARSTLSHPCRVKT